MTLEMLLSLLVFIMFLFGILSYMRTFNTMSLFGPIILSAFLSFASNILFNKEDLKKPIFTIFNDSSNISNVHKKNTKQNDNSLKNKEQQVKITKKIISDNTISIFILALIIVFILMFYYLRKKAEEEEMEAALNTLREINTRNNNSENNNEINNQKEKLEEIIKLLKGESNDENTEKELKINEGENVQLKNNNKLNIDFELNEKTTSGRKLSI